MYRLKDKASNRQFFVLFLFVKLKETQQNVFAAVAFNFFLFLPNKVKTSLKLLMKNNSTQIGNLNHTRHKNVIK